MSRKFWAVLSVLLVALLAITACAPVPAAPAQAPAPAKATEVPAPAADGTRHPDLGLLGQPRGGGEPQTSGRRLHEGAPGDQN